MKIDDTDRKIISLLQDDARQSNAAIARRAGVSEATIRRRVKLMVDDGTLAVRAVPNPAKLGLDLSAIIGFGIEPDKLDTAATAIADRDEISFLYVSAGRYDLIAWVRVKSLAELQAFLTGVLAKTPGVRKTETMVILDVKRQGFTWFGRL